MTAAHDIAVYKDGMVVLATAETAGRTRNRGDCTANTSSAGRSLDRWFARTQAPAIAEIQPDESPSPAHEGGDGHLHGVHTAAELLPRVQPRTSAVTSAPVS